MYKKLLEYLNELCETLSIEALLIEKDWPKCIKGKARRDLGVHKAC